MHAAAARKEAVVCGVSAVCTALSLVGSVAEVGIWSTASGPSPVVRSNTACTGRVRCAEGGGHVGDVDIFVWMVLLDGMMSIGATARLGTVAAIVRGDVLAKNNVAGTGRLGILLHDGFFFQFDGWLVQFSHHSGRKAAEENGNDDEG